MKKEKLLDKIYRELEEEASTPKKLTGGMLQVRKELGIDPPYNDKSLWWNRKNIFDRKILEGKEVQ